MQAAFLENSRASKTAWSNLRVAISGSLALDVDRPPMDEQVYLENPSLALQLFGEGQVARLMKVCLYFSGQAT